MRRTGPGWVTTKLTFVTVVLVAATLCGALRVAGASTGLQVAPPGPAAPAASATPHGMYAYYYLWWSSSHWQSMLGPAFPFNQSPLPLPATLDSSGCNASSLYSGNVETDSPATVFSQDDPAQINYDVQSAIAAGLTGFAVDWNGTGTPGQTPASDSENARLDMLVHAVDRAQASGQNFHLWISYKASATILTQSAITADLGYITSQYGNDPALDRSNGGKPTLIWVGSYKYPLSIIAAVSTTFLPSWYLVGGYQWNSWNSSVAPYFDADSPYWSSQDPSGNPHSFQQLAALSATLHSEGKAYFAPLAPGYNKQLDGGATCVPRDNGATLKALYAGNATANPDGWLLISWNEITEGTYVTPELQRYGGQYGGPNGLIHSLMVGSTPVPPATTSRAAPPTTVPRSVAPSQGAGAGYRLVTSAGQVVAFGADPSYGPTGALTLNRPMVAMASTPDGGGHWLVASDGGIFNFGDAAFHGSAGSLPLNKPIVAMAATSDGGGYWLVASDGGIFNFGDAAFHGSAGSLPLNKPIVGMAATSDGGGYWLVASDGGIFNFGDAAFHGSAGSLPLNKPIVGMAATSDGGGYWLVASDGGIFAFGDAAYLGAATGSGEPIVGIATR
jgi:hypothetical protein